MLRRMQNHKPISLSQQARARCPGGGRGNVPPQAPESKNLAQSGRLPGNASPCA
jgi:hypothetical protein